LIDLNYFDRGKGSIGREASRKSVKECTGASRRREFWFGKEGHVNDVVLARGELAQ
jgi:hypothetical protein